MSSKWTVKRLYKCTECKEFVMYEQNASDPFSTTCPNCNKEGLLLESGDCGLTTVVGLNTCKTVGSLGEKNYETAQKRGTLPDYVKNDKIVGLNKVKKKRHKILKNPDWYVQSGKVD